MGESDDLERRREPVLKEEHELGQKQNEDIQMQLQVIIEERDGLRDGMELLYQEKTRMDEELENVSEGYTNLSDRLQDKVIEVQELQEQLLQFQNLIHMLQDNFDKVRHSPPGNTRATAVDSSETGAAPA